MKKRVSQVLALACCLALAFTAFPPVFAEEAPPVSGECGAAAGTVTWALAADGTFTIRGTGAMADYHNLVDIPWYEVRDQIRTVSIEHGVTSIGMRAFDGCSYITSISIPDSVTEIGESAFSACSDISGIVLPDSVTKIGAMAFSSCEALKSITLPDGITSFARGTFSGCTNLTNITIPQGVTTLGEISFARCASLTDLTIPNSVTAIGSYAFQDCTGLKKVEIPESVTELLDGVFSGCTGLTSVVIPNSVTKLNAFSGCTGLTDITIPNSVTNLGGFAGCTNLAHITIPDSVVHIENFAFQGCTKLESADIPDSVTSIGMGAFQHCEALAAVNIPGKTVQIETGAFAYCTGLKELAVSEENSQYCAIGGVLYTKDRKELIAFPAGKMSGETFEIPNHVTQISDSAFAGNAGLTGIKIPNSVTRIGRSAFSGCSGLTSVTIPDGISTVEYMAFENCKGLTDITLPDSLTSLGTGAFWHCTGLTELTLPENLTSIGGSAFLGCTGLTGIRIPDKVTVIGQSAFTSCTGLTSITIPESVERLESWAFHHCTGLKWITFQGNPPETSKPSETGETAPPFENVTATAVYPADKKSLWTEEVRKSYGGNLTWLSSDQVGFHITFDECKPDGSSETVIKVTDKESGQLSEWPDNPSFYGYTFEGWYTAKEGGEKISAVTVFTADTVVYAHWKSSASSGGSGSGGSGGGGGGSIGGGSVTPPMTPILPVVPAPASPEVLKEENWSVQGAGAGETPVYRHLDEKGAVQTGSCYIRNADGTGHRYLFDEAGILQTGAKTAGAGETIRISADGDILMNGNLYYLNPNRSLKDPRTCYVMTDYIRVRPNFAGQTYYDKDGITFEGWLKTPDGGLRYQTRIPQPEQNNDLYLIVWHKQDLPACQHPDYPGDPAHYMPAGRYFFDDGGVLVTTEGWYDGGDGNEYYVTENGMVLWERPSL